MLKRAMLVMLILVCAQAARARERFWQYCQKGGYQVTTQGLKSTEYFQRTFRSCTVHVYVSGTVNLATLYLDNLSPATPMANPFTSASDGYFEFYAAAGRYDVQLTDTPTATSYTWGDVLLCDPIGPNADTATCGPGSGGSPHNLLSTTHPDTSPFTPPGVGDMIRGSSANLWEHFARGSASQLLAMNPAGTNLESWQNFNFYGNSALVNAAGRLGINLIPGANVTITPVDNPGSNRVDYTIASTGGGTSTTTRVCNIVAGGNASPVLVDTDIAPQSYQCWVPKTSTVIEVEVRADAGTPQVVVGYIKPNTTVSNLVSAPLATAAAGAAACSNTTGVLGLDGVTTCSATLQNVSVPAGSYFETISATAGGAAHLFTVSVTFTLTE